MGPNGENAHKLYGTDENGSLNCSVWSPGGKRIVYVVNDARGERFVNRDLRGGAPVLTLKQSEPIYDISWLPDGRLMYSKGEPDIVGGNICNFWELSLDRRTGKPVGKPKRITSWSGFCMTDMTVTADVRKLAFLKWTSRFSTYIADLDQGGNRILNLRHFTPSESIDLSLDWTPDSKTLILYSNRAGKGGIYRQALDETNPQPLTLASGILGQACVTPDGRWVLYLRREKPGEPESLMRIPRRSFATGFKRQAKYSDFSVRGRPPGSVQLPSPVMISGN
jgi:Tol biopolymer transport system component